jgi:hypothetical protein
MSIVKITFVITLSHYLAGAAATTAAATHSIAASEQGSRRVGIHFSFILGGEGLRPTADVLAPRHRITFFILIQRIFNSSSFSEYIFLNIESAISNVRHDLADVSGALFDYRPLHRRSRAPNVPVIDARAAAGRSVRQKSGGQILDLFRPVCSATTAPVSAAPCQIDVD